jgi:rSAM/selenodomain-associated transferase 1
MRPVAPVSRMVGREGSKFAGRVERIFFHENSSRYSEKRLTIPVCIFAKPPNAGEVKTRLAPELGDSAAAALAAAMLRDVWQVASSCPGVRPVLATTEQGEFPIAVVPEDVWLQGKGGLGSRLERILRKGLASAAAAVALGADTPAITVSHLELAIEALQTHDAAMGRCEDGGFYLLALRRCPEGLFADLPWSNAETATAMEKRLSDNGFAVKTLETLFDVDTPEDLPRLAAHLMGMPGAAPWTRAWYLHHDSSRER